jgi:hypothetical protein
MDPLTIISPRELSRSQSAKIVFKHALDLQLRSLPPDHFL